LITEKLFVLNHSAFWGKLLPMEHSYIRIINRMCKTIYKPLGSTSSSSQRGVINEVGFRLFRAKTLYRELTDELVSECIDDGLNHILHMRQLNRTPAMRPSNDDLAEARKIAERLLTYFGPRMQTSIAVFPRFSGCGWLEQCEGDVLSDNVLFEIKAGARHFRNIDLRQLLAYGALNFASKQYDIHMIGLFNPRLGRLFIEDVETVCRFLCGRSAVDVFGDIVDYVSSSSGAYSLQ
jgi:hypothetical protein